MIEPERLADRLQDCAVRLRSEGGLSSERFSAWRRAVMPRLFEPDDDAQEAATRAGRSERDEDDRRQDAQAAAYHAEWVALLKRVDADVARLDRLMSIANPQKPRELRSGERTAAQVIAEGSCPSCWRIGEDVAITLRPSKLPGESGAPFYKDRCKPCGDWRSEYGQDKPLPILRKHHQGRRVTTADVAKALGRTG